MDNARRNHRTYKTNTKTGGRRMDIKEAKELMKAWVQADRNIRGYEKGSKTLEEMGAYDRFCEERNIAIETIIEELERWENQ